MMTLKIVIEPALLVVLPEIIPVIFLPLVEDSFGNNRQEETDSIMPSCSKQSIWVIHFFDYLVNNFTK